MKLRRFLQLKLGLSRRKLFVLMKEGRILLNNIVVNDFSCELKIGDSVKIEGQTNAFFYKGIVKTGSDIVIYNKPIGYVVSKSDKFNETIFDMLPTGWKKKFYYVGRLDKDSHGLLLLVSDPLLVGRFEHPRNGFEKVYHVVVKGFFNNHDIFRAKKGLKLDRNGKEDYLGGELLSGSISILNSCSDNSLLEVVLKEGKNRHIRRLLKGMGYEVLDLKRISFGPYSLGNLDIGAYRFDSIKN